MALRCSSSFLLNSSRSLAASRRISSSFSCCCFIHAWRSSSRRRSCASLRSRASSSRRCSSSRLRASSSALRCSSSRNRCSSSAWRVRSSSRRRRSSSHLRSASRRFSTSAACSRAVATHGPVRACRSAASLTAFARRLARCSRASFHQACVNLTTVPAPMKRRLAASLRACTRCFAASRGVARRAVSTAALLSALAARFV
mmetsp:Transcript_121175/g.348133  ORF Transcript_121175/g.348133 Transcript_121175/m.348133 type:complete len:201 (-) Transcript_121175:2255-2857(-)